MRVSIEMSITLSDAQKLSARVCRKINEEIGLSVGQKPFIIMTDLLEEAGEVASIVKGLEGYKPPDKPKTKEMLATELSDVLYGIFLLAEHYNIALDEAFPRTVRGYLSRFTKHV